MQCDFVSILIQAFKNASLSKPQAGVSYTLETERMVPILESIQSTASWSKANRLPMLLPRPNVNHGSFLCQKKTKKSKGATLK